MTVSAQRQSCCRGCARDCVCSAGPAIAGQIGTGALASASLRLRRQMACDNDLTDARCRRRRRCCLPLPLAAGAVPALPPPPVLTAARADGDAAALSWALAAYRYTRYKSKV
jgi:hypothetical protein